MDEINPVKSSIQIAIAKYWNVGLYLVTIMCVELFF